MSDALSDPLASLPAGFRVEREGDTLLVQYRHRGMGCMLLFLGVWLAGWTVACVAMIGSAWQKPFLDEPMLYVGIVLFLSAEVAVAIFLGWFLFGRTDFVLAPEGLQVTKSLFTWSKTRFFPLEEIRGFRQVKDGGEGDDSFPSWGLVVEAAQTVKLLSRQEPQKSLWLGTLLAQWSAKEFWPSGDSSIERF